MKKIKIKKSLVSLAEPHSCSKHRLQASHVTEGRNKNCRVRTPQARNELLRLHGYE